MQKTIKKLRILFATSRQSKNQSEGTESQKEGRAEELFSRAQDSKANIMQMNSNDWDYYKLAILRTP
jgi:hypothetical protein